MTKTKQETTSTTTSSIPQGVGIWTVTKETWAYACNVIVTALRTTNKMVCLVENEIDNLDAEQKLRLDAITAQRTEPAT